MKDRSLWIVFGDIHDKTAALGPIPELASADGVIVTGDLTFNGGRREAERVLTPLANSVPRLYAQIGNMDRAEVADLLDAKGWNLHAKAVEFFPGLVLMGLGASSPTPFGTPSEFPEERLAAWLEQGYAGARQLLEKRRASGMQRPVLLLASHCPPYGTACDRLPNGASAGSHAVRAFIEARQPDFCLCGHIHEARAEDCLGVTRVINPGDLPSGGYLLLEASSGPDGPLVSVRQG